MQIRLAWPKCFEPAKEPRARRSNGGRLGRDSAFGRQYRFWTNTRPQAIARHLMTELKPGDVLVTLGAGDLGKIFHEFRERTGRDRAVA